MKSIFAASLLVSIALVLSRLSGFVREILLAARLGSSEYADGAILMLTLPDFMVGLLLTGGLNAALVPTLKSLQGPARQAVLLKIAVSVSAVFLLLALGLSLSVPQWILLVAPALDVATMPDFRMAFGLSIMALPIAALIGITASYLNTIGKFMVPGMGVLVFNALLSVYIAINLPNGGYLLGLAWMIIGAAMMRLVMNLYPVRAQLSGFQWSDGTLPQGFGWRFAQGIGAFSIIVGVPFLYRSLYAGGGDGYLTLFNYAQKLYELPAALMIAPVIVVLLPKLSAMVAQDDPQLYRYVAQGLRAILALAGVALCVGGLFMDVIVQIIFGYGAITAQDQSDITDIARLLLLAMPFYALTQIAGITLNAMARAKLFFILSVVSLIISNVTYMLLSYMVPTDQWAPLGYVVFFALLALSSFIAIFPLRLWSWHAVGDVVSLGLRLATCAAMIAGGMLPLPQGSLMVDIALMAVATIICALAILPELKLLLKMRIDTR